MPIRGRTPWRFGVQLSVNAVLIPLFVATLALFVWLDYRHEVHAFATIQQARASAASRGDASIGELGPAAPGDDPRAIAQRALILHTVHGALTIVLLVVATNAVLHASVLKPVERIRASMTRMERGDWRGDPTGGGSDEMASLQRDFQRFGFTLDAFVSQALRAEQQATIALVSKRTSQLVDPEVQRIAEAAATLQDAGPGSTRDAARVIATAAAHITSVTRSLDRLFESRQLRRS